MSRILVLVAGVLLWILGCRSRATGAGAAPAASELSRATCRTLESGPCPVETIELPLDEPGSGSVFAICVLGATGRIEACHGVDFAPPPSSALREALEARRYQPVTFQGQPVPVPYLFLVGPRRGAAHVGATSTSTEVLLSPTCGDLDYDRCTNERVVLDGLALQDAGAPGQLWTNKDLSANCILRESGVVESCRLERVPEAVARSVAMLLEGRRYRPVRYRGAAVPVAYGFTVTVSQPPSDARSEFRRAVLEFLVDEAIRQEADGGVRALCISASEDESPAEVVGIHRPGWNILPASR